MFLLSRGMKAQERYSGQCSQR